MTDRKVFKNNLRKVDRQTRMCLLYLEKTMNERFKTALQVKQPIFPKVDFSETESRLDSLQKQINGLRAKTDTAFAFTQEYDNAEIFLKKLVKEADEILSQVDQLFKDLYKSKYFKQEGIRRKIRDSGLMKEVSKNEPSGGLSN